MSLDNWPLADIHYLRVLWSQGIATAEIARRMGRSKNSIVGKAHRIDLGGRESPVRRKVGPPVAALPPRAPKLTLPPMADEPPAVIQRQVTSPVAPMPLMAIPTTRELRCEYLSGDGKPSMFVRCTKKATRRAYCDEHANLCYMKRRRDAEVTAG